MILPGNKKAFSGLIVLLLGASFISCSKDNATTTATDTTTSDSTASAASSAYPSSLAVSSPTAHQATLVQLTKYANKHLNSKGRVRIQDVTGDTSYADKKEALTTLLSSTTLADCAVTVTLQNSGNANCYGPNIDYTNHPEHPTTPNSNSGQLPGGDTGIWTATNTGSEACSAAQLNNRISGVASQVDLGMFVMAGLVCAANATSSTMPEAGESLDLTTSMEGLVSINSGSGAATVTVTSASIARETDTTDGYPVYVSTLVGTMGTNSVSIRLKHIPTTDDNSTYTGKLSIKMAMADGTRPGNCGTGSETGQTNAVSILYNKSSAENIAYELKSANFCGDSSDPYASASNYSVDLSKKFNNSTEPLGWGNNANYLRAQFNPSTLDGSYAFAWQAGMMDGSGRTFNAKVESGGTAATAWFGFGPDISNASTGDITKIVCNWAGPGADASKTGMPLAQKQEMTLTAGVFNSSSAHITYAPTNNCDYDGSGTFNYSWTINGTSGSQSSAVTNDLVPLTDITTNFTAPDALTDVE